ncbi:hypothetical protein [Pseudomonas costantinii]|uniref:hypothetical protein n=1 Tax=Pseudomonas costantinii TaxID=168469 RepID=UPI0015A0A527|nr:hypothetical protein [Pseudomonas costantinii]NVZ70501.1 hypothetical protein [Pseudomonas costantinii]
MASAGSKDKTGTDLKIAFKIAAFSSLMTLAGVLATSVVTLAGSAQTTRSSEKLSCVSRIDKREEYARIKSDNFMAALASLTTGSASPGFAEKKPSYVEAFSRAGYSLMLLTKTALGEKSGELSDWLTIRVADYKSFEKPPFIKDEYEKLVTEWKDAYYQYMEDLDTQRKDC